MFNHLFTAFRLKLMICWTLGKDFGRALKTRQPQGAEPTPGLVRALQQAGWEMYRQQSFWWKESICSSASLQHWCSLSSSLTTYTKQIRLFFGQIYHTIKILGLKKFHHPFIILKTINQTMWCKSHQSVMQQSTLFCLVALEGRKYSFSFFFHSISLVLNLVPRPGRN